MRNTKHSIGDVVVVDSNTEKEINKSMNIKRHHQHYFNRRRKRVYKCEDVINNCKRTSPPVPYNINTVLNDFTASLSMASEVIGLLRVELLFNL